MTDLQSVLCIFAHPDDEIFAGGTLARLSSEGVSIHLVCATRGENGAPGYPQIEDKGELGKVRTKEMQCAAKVLNATLHFLDYVDEVGLAGEMIEFYHQPETFRQEIKTLANEIKPDVILTHGSDGEYGHPAHKLIHRTVLDVVKELHDSPLVYSFQAYWDAHPENTNRNLNQSDPAHIIIDVAPFLQSHVQQLYVCHQTQSSWWIHLKTQKLGRDATPEESWMMHSQEGFHRHYPLTDNQQQPNDKFTRWFTT